MTDSANMRHIARLTVSCPRFVDGRIDYANERVCFVLNCVVVSGERVLLTKRGAKVIAYPNTISGVSGFIDNMSKTLEEIAQQELTEELGAPLERLRRLVAAESIVQIDDDINREWHVYPVLAEFAEEFAPRINWENKSAAWYDIADVPRMELMRGFREVFEVALRMCATTVL